MQWYEWATLAAFVALGGALVYCLYKGYLSKDSVLAVWNKAVTACREAEETIGAGNGMKKKNRVMVALAGLLDVDTLSSLIEVAVALLNIFEWKKKAA